MWKRIGGSALASVLGGAVILAAPAAAGDAVHIEADTPLDPGVSGTFESTLQGCETGAVDNGRARLAGSARFGIFNGFKVFTCAGDEGGFVIRLHATFDDTGSTGRWAIVDSWGSQDGLHGSGTLVGVPQGPDVILDIYDGTLRP
jgi:hypothetical protein